MAISTPAPFPGFPLRSRRPVAMSRAIRATLNAIVFLLMFALPPVVPLHGGESGQLEKMARQGNPKAQFDLGMNYFTGDHTPKNVSKALFWFRKSAINGYSWAEVWLGIMYFQGKGVRKDPEKALRWWKKAAEQGNPWAVDRFSGDY